MEIGSVNSPGSTATQFFDAIAIWCNKPHVVNRRLCGSYKLWTVELQTCDERCLDIARRHKASVNKDGVLNMETISERVRADMLMLGDSDSASVSPGNQQNFSVHVVLRCLIPKLKNRFKNVLELILIDFSKTLVMFYPLCVASHDSGNVSFSDDIPYFISYHPDEHNLSLHVMSDKAEHIQSPDGSTSCGTNWLSTVLLTRIARWSEETHLNTEILSLRQIDIQKYSRMYSRLKEKYGNYFVEIWTEQTDPQKFVFEDIGIAAYLLVLWERERDTKGLTERQSFIDLGCGNGLLVYILMSEGHPGVGVDIRRRKIWDVLERTAALKEETVTPSETTVLQGYDWLIGNHSDELTPWIPFIAARSNYNCRYFVLPCCAWDFTKKFADNSAGLSQYRVYLDYIRSVGVTCGFQVDEDVLRIPSTKRVCHIGMHRNYKKENETDVARHRQHFVMQRCQKSAMDCSSRTDDSSTVVEFQPRPATEKLRNAIAIDHSVKEKITRTVLEKVLSIMSRPILLDGGQTWNIGGSVSLNDLSLLFSKEILLKLKNECGGLQTVIKNCPDAFIVQGGCVWLRDWTSPEYIAYRESRRKKRPSKAVENRLKTSLCFFHVNHPDGCPLSQQQCRFAHGIEDCRVLITVNQEGS